MDLIYLRHGRTDWNDLGLLQGWTDIPLNDDGIRGAERAGKILARYQFDAIYCSPLSRTRQTLQYAYPGAEPILDDRLKEWCFGLWEGQRIPEEVFVSRWSFGQAPMEGAEQIEDVVCRAAEFYKDIKAKYPEGTVLVVSHGGFSGALHGAIYGVKDGEDLSLHCLPNSTPVLFREGQAPIILQEESDDE